MIHITLSGIPASKKNSKRICRGRLIASQRFMDWHKRAMIDLVTFQKPKEPIDKCKSVTINFFIVDNRRRDLSNMAESIMDLLVDSGFIKDDCYQVVPKLILQYFDNKMNHEDFVHIRIDD